MKTELLSPAGNFDNFLEAIYAGADAIYLAFEKYGARAYAKNFSFEELEKALLIAHTLNKKIYVTVNTICKTSELIDAYQTIDKLYLLGVDGLILADLALVNYTISNYPEMEAHISTQMGVKDLEDVRFFEKLKAKRCVIAREASLKEIRKIKESSKMPIEVFIHGALCVSYSGGCLMSSMISSRSGNRGRCSQCCRKEYTIYKNGNPITKKGFYLSMKDLNTTNKLDKLLEIGVDSLKIEGRMKNEKYVRETTSIYRKIIDAYPNKSITSLDHVFHRSYTEGFIFGEDKGKIVNFEKANNEGELIGMVREYKNGYIGVSLTKSLKLKDRIRIGDLYFTIDEMLDSARKPISSSDKFCFLSVRKNVLPNSNVYRMLEYEESHSLSEKYKVPLTIYASASINNPLVLTAFDGVSYTVMQSDALGIKSLKHPLSKETLINQMKLHDTPYKLEYLEANIEDGVYYSIKDINDTRRKLLQELEKTKKPNRLAKKKAEIQRFTFEKRSPILSVFVTTEEQYRASLELGVKIIYYKNYSPYVNATYIECNEPILVGNYGGLHYYKNHEVVTDYTFNVVNHEACRVLYQNGANRVTLSYEMSLKEIQELVSNYQNENHGYPNLEIICYGYQKLMTLKYCPLKSLGECGSCQKNDYKLNDGIKEFILTQEGCITSILNGSRLNLIDDLYEISKYANVIRLNFTIESANEVKQIIKMYQHKLQNLEEKTNFFNPKKDTRGYFKRPIL